MPNYFKNSYNKGTYIMWITKYTLDSGIIKRKIYQYFRMNEYTGNKDYIKCLGFKAKAEAIRKRHKITQ